MTDARLQDRVAIITGGSSGIGKASAFRFANSGARVAIVDLHSNGVEDAIKQQHGETSAIFIKCDVSQENEVKEMISQAVQWAGRLDILCNIAGIAAETPKGDYGATRCHTLDTEVFDRDMAVNCRGTWTCCKYALKQMMEQEPREPNARGERVRGWIVNTASIGGVVGMRTMPAYTPSKHAVVGMTRQMALDYGPDHIYVNCLAPGCIVTPLTAALLATKEGEERMAGLHPWNAVGRPEDVANAALFLASDEAAFTTGHVLMVDGGMTAQ